jgi:predicted transcriptional regulator
MLAKQISKNKEIYCTTDMPLTEVFTKMMELNCACMPVVESPTHKNIIGTITEHDICLKTITEGLNPQRIRAGRVLNGDFTTVNCDATVEECAELLKLTKAKRLFVIDENGAFMGILTEKELKSEKPALNLETIVTDLTKPSALPQKIQMAF